MSQTRDQQRFTISEVAADWHEPMVPQRIMWPSPALTDNLTHGAAVAASNSFPVIRSTSAKKSPFSRTAAHIFVSPGDAPATITQYVA